MAPHAVAAASKPRRLFVLLALALALSALPPAAGAQRIRDRLGAAPVRVVRRRAADAAEASDVSAENVGMAHFSSRAGAAGYTLKFSDYWVRDATAREPPRRLQVFLRALC